MPASTPTRAIRSTVRRIQGALAAILVGLVLWRPEASWATLRFALGNLFDVTPIVIPGIVLAAWITASGASDRVASVLHDRPLQAVLAATAVGAISPVCGITVLPLMAGLLAAGVPLAPVMAFWLASPVTDPAMLAVTVATLGPAFAIGKTLAAVGLGLLGGVVTGALADRQWVRQPLRSNRFVGSLGAPCGGSENDTAAFNPFIWREKRRWIRFSRALWSITRLMLLVLVPAFAAEFLLNAWLQPDALESYVGQDNIFAIPLAVLVGGPAYLDGYAALPLTRSLLAHGMSPGAAMAFLVSGGVVSVWGAMAIFPVLRLQPFMLYVSLALVGSMAAGWIFGVLG